MKQVHAVTGSSGFLGQRLIAKLLEDGHTVVGIDVNYDPNLDQRVLFHKVDIRDEASLVQIFHGVDVVHHTAALVPLTRAYNDFFSVNVLGSRSAASAALRAQVKTFIHTSSSAIYGASSNKAIDSDTVLKPIEPYGVSKLAGEAEVRSVFSGSGTQLVIIRPRTILGDGRGGIFDLFFSWIRDGLPIFTIGSGENLFQFVHVDDIISATFTVLDSGKSGSFNVGTENFGTLNQAFQNLIKATGSKSRLVHLPAKPTILGLSVLEKLRLSPLGPWHYKTFHLPFYFEMKPLTDLGWNSQYSNDELFLLAYQNYLKAERYPTDGSMSPHRRTLNASFLGFIQKFFIKA